MQIPKLFGNRMELPSTNSSQTYAGTPFTTIKSNTGSNSQLSLGEIALAEGFTTIENDVFKNNSQLRTISFPSTITSIGANSFSGCPNLVSITFSPSGAPVTIASTVFLDSTITITLPHGSTFSPAGQNVTVLYYPAPLLNQSPLFITDPGALAVGDSPFTLAFTGGNGKGSIIFSSDNTTVISISGTLATIIGAGSCTITLERGADSSYNSASATRSVTVSPSSGSPVPCFTRGTMIRVPGPEKEAAVETLKRGDLVVTADGRTVAIKGLYTTRVVTTVVTAPYLIPAGTYGSAQPRDLLLSPKHAIQIRKGVWNFPGFATLTNPAIRQVAMGEAVDYYHLECPVFLRDNLIANGCVVESFGTLQVKHNPYTYSARLGGFTREGHPGAPKATASL